MKAIRTPSHFGCLSISLPALHNSKESFSRRVSRNMTSASPFLFNRLKVKLRTISFTIVVLLMEFQTNFGNNYPEKLIFPQNWDHYLIVLFLESSFFLFSVSTFIKILSGNVPMFMEIFNIPPDRATILFCSLFLHRMPLLLHFKYSHFRIVSPQKTQTSLRRIPEEMKWCHQLILLHW